MLDLIRSRLAQVAFIVGAALAVLATWRRKERAEAVEAAMQDIRIKDQEYANEVRLRAEAVLAAARRAVGDGGLHAPAPDDHRGFRD